MSILPESKQAWDIDTHGGSRHYLVAGEEEELVTVAPKANTLSLVYRDKVDDSNSGLLHFTRFVNHLAPSPMFQYSAVYRVAQDDEGGEDEQSEQDAGAEAEDKWEKVSN